MAPSAEGLAELAGVVFAAACRHVRWAALYRLADGRTDVLGAAFRLARDACERSWSETTPLDQVRAALSDALELSVMAAARRRAAQPQPAGHPG